MLFAFTLVEALGRARPAWAWARSLPWSSRTRVRFDVELLVLAAAPVVAVAAALDIRALLPVAGVGLYALLRALTTLRPGNEGRERPTPATLAECVVVALVVGVHAAWAFALVPGIAFAWRRLVSAERGHRVSAWRELQHGTAGDPLS